MNSSQTLAPPPPRGGHPKTVIGFDFGERRIGLAIWESVTRQAAPLGVVSCTAKGPDWSAIDEHVSQWRPDLLVVGIPLGADGAEHAMTARARGFARRLKRRFHLPVEAIDETYSSLEARESLREQRRRGVRRKRLRKGDVDQRAAQIILERWYNLRGPELG